jgi:uncharacterized membrane protein
MDGVLLKSVASESHYGLKGGGNMRAFAIVAILIVLLVTVYLVSRDTTSRMSENEEQSKITAIEKAKETKRKIDQLNKVVQKRLKEIQSE